MPSLSPKPKTISVTTLWDDAIVSIKEFSPSPTKATKRNIALLFVVGGLLLACSTVMFIASVHASKVDNQAKAAWMAADPNAAIQRSKHRFRPQRVTAVTPYEAASPWPSDIIFLLSGLFGLGLIGTGLIKRTSRENQCSVENHTLVDMDSGSINLSPQMHGVVGATSLTGGQSIQLTSSPVSIFSGATTYQIADVGQQQTMAAKLFSFSDSQFNLCLSGVVTVVALLFGLNAFGSEADATALSASDKEAYAMLHQNDNKDSSDPLSEPDESIEDGPDSAADAANNGAAAALDPGAMGTTKSTSTTGTFTMKKRSDMPSLAKSELMDMVRAESALGALSQQQDMFASLTGLSDVSSGFQDEDIMGAFDGPHGERAGIFGMAKSGFDKGGGGVDFGTVGVSDRGLNGPGTTCPPNQICSGSDPYGIHGANGPRTRRPRPDRVPAPRMGSPVTDGSLDKSVIRRYVRRKLPQVKHCYEKQVLVNSQLEGTVATNFLIGPDGSVKSSSASGVSPKVSTCVASVMKSIKFPKPKGGGLVNVRYPFRFNAPR